MESRTLKPENNAESARFPLWPLPHQDVNRARSADRCALRPGPEPRTGHGGGARAPEPRASRSRSRHGRWQIDRLSDSGDFVRGGAEKEGGGFHPHHQFAGTAHGKGFADARDRPGFAAGTAEIQFHDAQGPRELSLHAPFAKSDAAGRQSVHVVGIRGTQAHLRVVEGNHGRQPVGFRHRTGYESMGAGLFRAGFVLAENLRASVRFRQGPRGLFFSAGAEPHFVLGRAGVESHAVFHAARRRGRGHRGRHPFQE